MNKAVNYTKVYPFVQVLEDQWLTIWNELQALCSRPLKTFEHSRDGGWELLVLNAMGETNRHFSESCPETVEILGAIPGLVLATISKLRPGAIVHRHTDRQVWLSGSDRYITYNRGEFIRCHLAMKVPGDTKSTECAIKIEEEVNAWEPGKCLVFDCNASHEAWNRTNEDRVVLIVDFTSDGSKPSLTEDMVLYKNHLVENYM